MWNRSHHLWNSAALQGRPMDLLVVGHDGPRIIVFPTSQGSFHEWEDRKMFDAIGDELTRGELQLFCVASADDASWYNDAIPLNERAEWQERYDRYLHDEVVPFTLRLNDDPFLITAGASFGGYHALNFACRYPDLVGRVLSMSGLPDIRRLTGGWSDGRTYFHNPAEFMRLEHDPHRLAAFRQMDIILAVGHDDSLRPANEEFSRTLWGQGIGNALRIWDGWAHDWPWWQKMLRLYIGGHD